jgi:hypothetical protein
LWALLAGVAAGCVFLARRRSVDGTLLVAAWALSSILLWFGAAVLGFAGGAVQRGLHVAASRDMAGFAVGAPVGALAGALLGIGLAERGLRNRWPRWPALALGGVSLAIIAAVVLLILQGLAGTEQQAGKSILIVFPLLGAAPVLGWLIGTKP